MKINKKMTVANHRVPIHRAMFAISIGVLCFAASRLVSTAEDNQLSINQATLATAEEGDAKSTDWCAVRVVP